MINANGGMLVKELLCMQARNTENVARYMGKQLETATIIADIEPWFNRKREEELTITSCRQFFVMDTSRKKWVPYMDAIAQSERYCQRKSGILTWDHKKGLRVESTLNKYDCSHGMIRIYGGGSLVVSD